MSAPFMQLYVADYLGDTRHLTTEQHGAYLLLLMTMWRSDGVLSSDPAKLARIAGLTVARWRKIGDDVLAFFTPCEGGLTQGRLAAELTIADEKSAKNAQAGRLGGRAKALKDKKAQIANASGSPCPPEPEPDTTVTSVPVVRAPARPAATKRCPVDWIPSAADLAVGDAEGLTPGEIDRALAKMRDHEFKTSRRDWSAVCRNWLRAEAERKSKNDRSDRYAAKQSNYDAALAGSEWADQVLVARRAY